MKKLFSIRTLLAVVLMCGTMGADSCKSSRLDRTIAAIEIASTLPAALQLPAAESQVLTTAFGAISASLRTFRERPSASTWQNALNIFDDLQRRNVFRISDPVKQARITAIVAAVRALVDSITPPAPQANIATSGAVIDSPPAAAMPNVRDIKESDVKALEEAVKRAKQ